MTTPTSSDSQIDLSPDGPVPPDPEIARSRADDESPPNGRNSDNTNGDTSPTLAEPESEPASDAPSDPEAKTADPEPETEPAAEPDAETIEEAELEAGVIEELEADTIDEPAGDDEPAAGAEADTEVPPESEAEIELPDEPGPAQVRGVRYRPDDEPVIDEGDPTATSELPAIDPTITSDDAKAPEDSDGADSVDTPDDKAPIGVPARSDTGGVPVGPGRSSAPPGFPPSLIDEMRAAERRDPTTLGAFAEPTAEHPVIRVDEPPPVARPLISPSPPPVPADQEPVTDDEALTVDEQAPPYRSDNGEVTSPALPDLAEPAPDEPVVKPPLRELPVLPEHLISPRRPPVVEELRWADETEAEIEIEDEGAPLPAAEPVQEAYEIEEQREDRPALGGLELRQVAGLTAGSVLELTEPSYAFAQGKDQAGFTINVDTDDQVVVVPGAVAATIDTIPVAEPTVLGADVLDVGTARFLVIARRRQKRATDWLDLQASVDVPPPPIHVPPELTADAHRESTKKGRLFGRRSAKRNQFDPETLGAIGWDLIETVRTARTIAADMERHLQPDPAELAVRVANRAPILGLRRSTDPLFGTVGVICADMPWMPQFDDVTAIPSWLSPQLQPLMSLPSIPIAADLRIGPLGIATGSRNAALACARHILLSLYALSGEELRVHVVANDDRAGAWEWARRLTPFKAIDPGHGYPVVIVDGMESFAATGLSHQDAIEGRVGLVVLADDVDGLPPYSGTVLQVDQSGAGRLTNHKGHVISGTPIGVTADYAQRLANDLVALSTPARHF